MIRDPDSDDRCSQASDCLLRAKLRQSLTTIERGCIRRIKVELAK